MIYTIAVKLLTVLIVSGLVTQRVMLKIPYFMTVLVLLLLPNILMLPMIYESDILNYSDQ